MADVTLVERDAGLVTVTLNRPHRKNAINPAIWLDLDRIVGELETDPTVRAVILAGADGNFSAGADLSGEESNGLTGHGAQAIVHEMRIVGRIISRWRNLPRPTLAAVDGVVVGVSLGIALACDLVIATDRTRFMEVFAKRGLALDGGTSWLVPNLVGARRAKQMAYFGDTVDAATALEWGLVNEVVPPEELATTVLAWGRLLADGPTTALCLMKAQINASASITFDEALEGEARAAHIAYTTADMHEGMRAFAERREPRFTGR